LTARCAKGTATRVLSASDIGNISACPRNRETLFEGAVKLIMRLSVEAFNSSPIILHNERNALAKLALSEAEGTQRGDALLA
jgi:hypothetical protein